MADSDPVARGVERKVPSNVGLRDVARAAGVSTATVSRAMNTPDLVSDILRERIAVATRDLGWVPHGAARALTTRRSHAIGAVFPTLSHGDFARAAEAMQGELAQLGYTLLLACSQYSLDQEYQLVRQFVERGVDALALVGAAHRPELTELLATRRMPYVNTFVYDPESREACIGPDNRQALQRMTQYLVDLGHTRFAIIAQSTENNDRAKARLQGVRDALAMNGLRLRTDHFAEGRWGIREGRALFRQIIRRKPWPTAVICGNAYLSVGALLEALSLQLDVPRDISIVGYDDVEIMQELPVPLTTVRVRSDEVGRKAAQRLVAQLDGRPFEAGWECETEIVVRASSGPPPLEPTGTPRRATTRQ